MFWDHPRQKLAKMNMMAYYYDEWGNGHKIMDSDIMILVPANKKFSPKIKAFKKAKLLGTKNVNKLGNIL
jgi:hypothetical protein